MRAIAIIATAITLSACAAQHAKRDDATCRNYGAKPGTDVYVQCRMQQQARRDQNDICVVSGNVVSCY